MKKLFATFMALVMMLSLMSVTAFAAEKTYKISVPDDDTHTYDVYQIFTGDLSEDGKVLSNVKWGQNGTGEEGKAVDQKILDELEAVKDASTSAKLEVINKYWNKNSAAMATIGGDNESEINNVKAGYYLIKDTADFEPDEEDSYSTYIVKVVNDVKIARKADIPKFDKKIVEGTEKVTENTASVGDTINYEITGTVPSNIADYATYFYKFNDTLSKGLTYNDDMTITVDGVDVTEYFYKNASTDASTGETTINVSIQDLLALNKLDNVTITKESVVVLTYSAELNKDAVIEGEGNPNDVTLTYSNNPNDSGKPTTTPPTPPTDEPKTENPTGETVKKTVKTYTTELTILKTDENGKVLTGAAFKLEGTGVVETKVTGSKFEKDPYTATTGETVKDGTYYLLKDGTYTTTAPTEKTADKYDSTEDKYVCVDFEKWITKNNDVSVEAYVNENGKLVFTGLGEGTYKLTETKTPAGYNSIDPVTVTIAHAGDGTFYISELAKTDADNNITAESMTMSYTVVNHSGAELPSTGGIGTYIFYAVGGILVLAAAVLFVTKKRMGVED